MTSKKKFDLPFKVIKSEVSGGFIDNIHNSYTGGIDLTNLHEDKYGDLDEAVLQSPFTERWVGGKLHRHVNLNTDLDTAETRPEAFHTEFVADGVRFYSHKHLESPPAYWTRDGLAKRPLNIANIRNTNLYVGNHSRGYEYLQTTGRRLTNNLIVDGFVASGGLSTQFINSVDIRPYWYQDGQPLTSSDGVGNTFDFLGSSVAISSDGTVIVGGSYASDSPGTSAGSLVVYKSSSLGWYQDGPQLTSSDGTIDTDLLGSSVAINSDGTAIVGGGYASDSPAAAAGSLVVFKSSSLGWYQDGPQLTSSTGILSDYLGWSVAINSDATVIVGGSPQSDIPGTSAGSLVVFKSSSLGWYQDGTPLTSNDGAGDSGDLLGQSVAISSDGTVIVGGSPRSDSPIIAAGSLVVFKSSSLGWYQDGPQLTSSDGTLDTDYLGESVAISSDGTVIVGGSPASDSPVASAGSLVVFKSSSLGWYQDGAQLTSSGDGGIDGDNLGQSVSISSDGTVIVGGSNGSDSPTTGAGSLIVFRSSSLGWGQNGSPLTSTGDNGIDGDTLGVSVAINSNATVIVGGSPNSDIPGSLAGSLIVFNYSSEEVSINVPYRLPDLTQTSKTVIAERFNAPGSKEESSRGSLDREGEEMSPNIPLPWRSYKIRKPFYEQLSERTPQGGGSIHGVNRNRTSRAGNELVDNGFVVRSLPGSDIQYSWITASALTTADELGGYQNFAGAYNRSEAYSDIEFISGSFVINDGQEYLVNNSLINSLVKGEKSVDLVTNTFSISASLSASFSEYTNTPYTFTSWTSIRSGETPLARLMRKRNIISVQDEQPEIVTTTGGPRRVIASRRGASSTNFIEPPVTFKYRPLVHKFVFKGNTTNDLAHNVIHTYVNNLSTFANKQLLNRLKSLEDRGQFYNLIYNYYTNPDAQEDNPIERFVRYTYKEIVWPREQNTGLDKARTRARYYLDKAGFDHDGFDKQLGTQRAFWRDEAEDRRRSSNTAGGYYSSMNYLSTEETGSNFSQSEQSILLNNAVVDLTFDFTTNSNQDRGYINSITLIDGQTDERELFLFSGSITSSYHPLYGVETSEYNKVYGRIVRRAYNFDSNGEFNNIYIDSLLNSVNYGNKTSIGALYRNTSYKSLLTGRPRTLEDTTDIIAKTEDDEIFINPKVKYVSFIGGGELNTSSFIQDPDNFSNKVENYSNLGSPTTTNYANFGFRKDNYLYLGGYLNFAANLKVGRNGIVRYNLDTQQWDSAYSDNGLPYPTLEMGNGTNASIFVDGDITYLGHGLYTSIDEVPLTQPYTYILEYSEATNTWNALFDGGVSASVGSGGVYTINKIGSSYYFGGSFDFAGTSPPIAVGNIVRWRVGPGYNSMAGGTNGPVVDSLVHNNKLYIVGDFTSPGNYIAYWDGFTWNTLSTGLPAQGIKMATYQDYIYVVGWLNFNDVRRWDTNTLSWTTISLPGSVGGSSIYVYEGIIYVTTTDNKLLKYNGSGWDELVSNSAFNSVTPDIIGYNQKLYLICSYNGTYVYDLETQEFYLLQTGKGVLNFEEGYFSETFSQSDFYFSTLDNGLVRQTEQYTTKKPFFDSYEDYIEDARSFAKDYSTIPEFKISDHIQYYVKENNKNFRSQNKKFLLLDGQENYRSAENETSSYDTQFFNDYATSDLMKKHDDIKEENFEVAKVDEINLKISGVKKLLPYNGFYPQDRTVQLANLYNDYVENNLHGGVFNLNYKNDFLKKKTIESIGPANIRSSFTTKYLDKNYLALGRFAGGSNPAGVLIYRTNDNSYDNWNTSPEFFSSSVASQVILLSASNGLNVFYPDITASTGPGGMLTSNTYDGINWSTPERLYVDGSSPVVYLTGSSLDSQFGYSFDLIYEQTQEKIIMAVGSPTADPVSTNEGEVYIVTGSLENNQWKWSDKQLIYSGLNISDYAGGVVSMLSCSSGYQLFIASPHFGFDSITGSILISTSVDGITWSTPGKIVDGLYRFQSSNIGTDMKSIDFAGKTYLFFSEPFGTIQVPKDGGVVVVTSSVDNVWNVGTSADKRVIYSAYSIEEFSPSPSLGMDSISLLSSSNGYIYYGIVNRRTSAPEVASIFLGKTDGEEYWETVENSLGLNLVEKTLAGYNCVVTIPEIINGNELPVYITDIATVSDRDIYIIKNNVVTEYVLRIDEAEKFYKHAALEPFFAPGILYNTIKSGLAVDWACSTGSDTSVVPPVVEGPSIIINNYYPKEIEMASYLGSYHQQNIYGNLRSRIDYRVPFENILFPNEAFKTKDLLTQDLVSITTLTELEADDPVVRFLDGTYVYSAYEPYISRIDFADVDNLGAKRFSVPFVYRKNNGSDTGLYTLGMSNFLAETVKFFLKDQKMTTFVSDPDYKWKEFNSDKTYYMDIVLEKSEELVMMEAYHSDKHPTGSNGEKMNGRYFGYPVNKTTKDLWAGASFTEEEGKLIHNDPAYAPYTPPYFEGEARARISFKPESDRAYSLQEIFDKATVENIFLDVAKGADIESDAYVNKMPIESSIDIFGSAQSVEVTIDERTGQQIVRELQDSQTWIISPRMETPVLDFASQSLTPYENNYSKTGGYGRGMWSGYGEVPSGGKGVKLRLEDPFTTIQSAFTASLLEQIGLRAEEKNIGTPAEAKVISEAIVAIPYLETADANYTVYNESGFNFIKIDRQNFGNQYRNYLRGSPAVPAGSARGVSEDIQTTTITNMIDAMQDYIMPPEFNFLQYDDIHPFVMYIFEFEHTLDRQDLTDIWQGLMPKISYTAEAEDVIISHRFGNYEFFEGKELPDNLRWLVFKVKQKGEYNYFNVTSTTKDDSRFDFNKIIGRAEGTDVYSYNWPYDYFSLVELAKLEISVEYKSKKQIEAEREQGIIQEPDIGRKPSRTTTRTRRIRNTIDTSRLTRTSTRFPGLGRNLLSGVRPGAINPRALR